MINGPIEVGPYDRSTDATARPIVVPISVGLSVATVVEADFSRPESRGGRLQPALHLPLSSGMPHYPYHLRSFDYSGCHRYFLTFCAYSRQPLFLDGRHVECVLHQFLRAADATGFAITAYCFMPDHVHMLVTGVEESASLKTFCARAKQFSGFHFKREFKLNLWQRFGYERVLRGEESTEAVARYIVANPIRSRLVGDVRDYPYWGSQTHGREALLDYVQWASQRAD